MKQLMAGTVENMLVTRESEFGYFLTNGEQDVLLHKSEVSGSVELDTHIDVFLYVDKQGRLAATTKIPSIQIDKYDWAEVVEMKKDLGVFVSIGINKEILVSKDSLPKINSLWPQPGDKVFMSLQTDKKGRLLGQLATEDIIQSIAEKADQSMLNKDVTGRVYRTLAVGSFIITGEKYRCFIHESERKEEPRLGSEVSGRVIDVKEDGSLNVSLLPRKQESLQTDAEMIHEYLEGRGGAMPYTDKTHPEDIQLQFGISKAAFKRALGNLMKQGKVYQENGWTYLTTIKKN